jgi:hypothetical protein
VICQVIFGVFSRDVYAGNDSTLLKIRPYVNQSILGPDFLGLEVSLYKVIRSTQLHRSKRKNLGLSLYYLYGELKNEIAFIQIHASIANDPGLG